MIFYSSPFFSLSYQSGSLTPQGLSPGRCDWFGDAGREGSEWKAGTAFGSSGAAEVFILMLPLSVMIFPGRSLGQAQCFFSLIVKIVF